MKGRAPGKGFNRVVRRARFAMESVTRKGFEHVYDVRTGGDVDLRDLGVETTDRVSYNPTPWIPLWRALKRLGPGPDDVFADLGSGKGLALVVAGRFPFRRVIGVELSEELTRLARGNVERTRPRLRARDIELITHDVVEWEVPDDLSFVFMYCPFTGAVFDRAMDRVIASYDRAPRALHILYMYPWEHNRLLRTGRVVVEDVRPGRWPAGPRWFRTGWVIVTYRVVAAGESTERAAVPCRSRVRARALARWSAPNDQVFRVFRPNQETLVSDPS